MTGLDQVQRAPVVMLVALAYVTLAFLTDPFSPTLAQLLGHGALRPVEVADGEPWRILSHAFLHGGILHLLINLAVLLQLGPLLELSLGSPRFLALYVVSALGGGIAVCLVRTPLETVVGGSGALFGMLGAVLALGMRSGRHTLQFFEEGAGKQIVALIAVNLVAGWLFPMISNTAHVGGLVAGFAASYWFLTPARVRPDRGTRALQAGMLALLCTTLLYALRPVARWDWLLLQWQATTASPQRDQLARAFATAWLEQEVTAVPDDAEMEEVVRWLAQQRLPE